MTYRPLLITTGEPAGIGMDIVLQLAADGTLNRLRKQHNLPPFVVTACPKALKNRQKQLITSLDKKPNWQVIHQIDQQFDKQITGLNAAHDNEQLDFLLLPVATKEPVIAGQININNAAMVLEQLRLAHTLASQQMVAGIVTAPLQKSALIDANLTLPDGTAFSGHTEYFMQMNGMDGIHNKVVMMLANQKMKVALTTTHLPLHAVPSAITTEQVRLTACIVLDSLTEQFGIANPKVLVCGLNPHAGEGGHLGKEELTIINPVLTKLQEQGHDISLAMPADTLFTQRYLNDCDAIIAMYHDQGLPVLKSHGFGDSINITLGLSYVRTSVDHGTALDLAGTAKASPSSLAQALISAIEMTNNLKRHPSANELTNAKSKSNQLKSHDMKTQQTNLKPLTANHIQNNTHDKSTTDHPLSTALTAFGNQVFARHASIHIDTNAIRHNLQQIKTLAKHAKILAMVKADAYGHGVKACLPALQEADAIAVACLEEAISCQQLGWDKPILLTEGAFSYDEWLLCQNQQMMCVIHQQRQLQWALSWADVHLLPRNTNTHDDTNDSLSLVRPMVWVKYNTGMNRLGFDDMQTQTTIKQLYAAGFDVVLMSHFANANSISGLNDKTDIDEIDKLNQNTTNNHAQSSDTNHPQNDWLPAKTQIQRFDSLLHTLKQTVSPHIQGSLCNSAGIIRFPNQHHDWVRPGILLYGSSPFSDIDSQSLGMRAVMTFTSRIMAIHALQAGDCVGYGSRWIAKDACHIAVVSVGYGDGYPRVVDKTAHVNVMLTHFKHHHAHTDLLPESVPCPIVGRVAMDMLMIDISHLANHHLKDKRLIELIGSDVILWGQTPQAPHIDAVAKSANTISYELMCRLSQRPQRITDQSQ